MPSTEYTYIDYVIHGDGYLTMEQHFDTIPFVGTNGGDLTQSFDSTLALQVDYDVRLINNKLGIYKDATNITVIDSSSSIIKDDTRDDYITINNEEFLNNISEQQITSVGKYADLYKVFKQKVNKYFGYAHAFESIFDGGGTIFINSDDFTARDLLNIITERYVDDTNNSIYKLNGFIQIYQLTNILNFVTETNPFNNRIGHTREDGFIDGDRILISNGITITLDLHIENKSYIENPIFEEKNILQHTINLPLLITLKNLS